MKADLNLSPLIRFLSPRAWLALAILSTLLAAGSSWVLMSRIDTRSHDLPGLVFDSVERFVRDTIRLSFTGRMKSSLSESVYVAPQYLLDKDATFNWLENSQDIEARQKGSLPPPIAPLRLLDPHWKPDF